MAVAMTEKANNKTVLIKFCFLSSHFNISTFLSLVDFSWGLFRKNFAYKGGVHRLTTPKLVQFALKLLFEKEMEVRAKNWMNFDLQRNESEEAEM